MFAYEDIFGFIPSSNQLEFDFLKHIKCFYFYIYFFANVNIFSGKFTPFPNIIANKLLCPFQKFEFKCFLFFYDEPTNLFNEAILESSMNMMHGSRMCYA